MSSSTKESKRKDGARGRKMGKELAGAKGRREKERILARWRAGQPWTQVAQGHSDEARRTSVRDTGRRDRSEGASKIQRGPQQAGVKAETQDTKGPPTSKANLKASSKSKKHNLQSRPPQTASFRKAPTACGALFCPCLRAEAACWQETIGPAQCAPAVHWYRAFAIDC